MYVDIRKILKLWNHDSQLGDEGQALVTVVRVAGSTYRKPGARMLITRGGLRAGTISGGCLEAEVSNQIWWLTKDGPCVRDYKTSSEDGDQPTYGLGCEGTITLLLERDSEAAEVLRALDRSVRQRTSSAIVTVIESTTSSVRIGSRIAFTRDHDLIETSQISSELRIMFQPIGLRILKTRRSEYVSITCQGGELKLFAEYVGPPPAIFIFGAGDDAQPLSYFAHAMGWDVTVADGRSNLLSRGRFPSADRLVVLCGDRPLNQLYLDPEDIVVLLTHSYQQDLNILRGLLKVHLGYVGVLGPKRRTARILQEIAADTGACPKEMMTNLRSPVGLDLGSGSPEVIALSIVAEIQAELGDRSAKPLHLL